jgi:hypothetical protein
MGWIQGLGDGRELTFNDIRKGWMERRRTHYSSELATHRFSMIGQGSVSEG